MTINQLERMSDDTLVAETTRVAESERRSMAELLALLIEVERRGLHLALGHSSLLGYCVRVLRFSEQAAYSRITAARAARRYPRLLDLLAEGALTLSNVGTRRTTRSSGCAPYCVTSFQTATWPRSSIAP